MSFIILIPLHVCVAAGGAAALAIALIVLVVLLIRRNAAIRNTLGKISQLGKSLSARAAERKKEIAAFVAEIESVQNGGTAATKAVEMCMRATSPTLSEKGMAEENALTAALFPLYVQEKSYPELYGNVGVCEATASLKAADSAFEAERKAYNAECEKLTRQTSTKSGRFIARVHRYVTPPLFPDP